jgi:hypothetical protein
MISGQFVVFSDPLSELGCRVPRGYCQTYHIGERPGIVISNLPDQHCDLWREHRLAGDDLGKWRQRSFMISSGNSIKDEAVPEPASEPHPHSGPWHGGGVLLSRYGVLERPVQVAERDIDSHPGNRQFGLAVLGHTR